ncbi:MAG: class I SAM-dependent methyltransferase [Nitrospinae bacterium]|nr:class I SAM-dependent methyltransferase [Nitrospinota bacterium]
MPPSGNEPQNANPPGPLCKGGRGEFGNGGQARFPDKELGDKILEENRRVHARENRLYLDRHPEQTNLYQAQILKNAVRKVCRLLPPGGAEKHVLDLGCGTGYLFLPLLARGYRMTGIDLSPELAAFLETRIPEPYKDRASLAVADVLEFADRDRTQYDAVVLSALLHHLYDYETAVRKYCGKLKPGGLFLIFFEPLKQAIASPLRYGLHKAAARLDEAAYGMEMKIRGIPLFEEDYRVADYQRQFGGIDPARLEETMRAEGMEILELEKYCARRYALSAFVANLLLGTQNTFNLLARKT